MTLKEVFKSIDKYLDSDSHAPKLVDVPTREDELELYGRYHITANKVKWAHDFCKSDMMPSYDKIMDNTTKEDGNIFLFGLSTFLKLEGKGRIISVLKAMVDLNPVGKLVIVSQACGEIIKKSFDKRLLDSYRVLVVDSDKTEKPVRFEFVERKLSANFELIAEGLNKADRLSEIGSDDDIIVRTSHKKSDFPDSLADIKEISCTFDLLVQQFTDLSRLSKDVGTEGQWNYLYLQVVNNGGLSNYIDNKFGGTKNLAQSLKSFKDYDANDRWTLFIALMIYGAPATTYLSEVIGRSNTVDELCGNLYLLLLEKNWKGKEFKRVYEERKELLKGVCDDTVIVSDFCKRVIGKGADALYYLTNLSSQEREQIIWTLSRYAEDFDRKKLPEVLEIVYPQLANYLDKFDYKDKLLNVYFNEYKYCKVTNRISDELRNMVEKQSVERDYNKLQPRATYVDKLAIDNHCKAYFVDALGVEYLSYIQALCHDNNLFMQVNIGRCNLPSITEFNKDFVNNFTAKGIKVIDVKDIDDLMHEGVTDDNYEYLKEPIHISEQLQALDKLISSVIKTLNDGKTDRIFLLSDHGATRMVVINDKENKWEVSNKGEHSGRCCLVSELDDKPDNAAEENEYWCLANYDRFKGGRMSGVELHGGATLEEVCVPIITVTRKEDKIDCVVTDESKVITVSFKKKARIRLFISKELDNVSIRIENGDVHQPSEVKDKYFYDFDIPEVKRAGTYHLNVYAGDNIIATGLTFEVKKEGASERKFF